MLKAERGKEPKVPLFPDMSVGFPGLVEPLEVFQRLHDHQFRIACASRAAVSDKPVEQSALLVIRVDAGVDQPVDPPRPFESKLRDVLTGHPAVLRCTRETANRGLGSLPLL